MTYYTDNNQIKELMLDTVDVEVKELNALFWLPPKDVTLYLFDTSLFSFLLVRRPDWGGTILELMKKAKVYIFWGIDWCLMLYHQNMDDFRFICCNDPIIANDPTCLTSENPIHHNVKDAILELMEPIRFGQAIAKRFNKLSNDCGLKSMLDLNRGSYREICMNLEDLVSDVIRQRDQWKDRFFFKAIEADSNELCSECKEDMRQAFYERGNEEAALAWRPGKWGDCPARKCKHYSWQAFEIDDDDAKTEMYVSSSDDEECNCSTCSLKKESQ